MSKPILKVENLSKQYRLGNVGTGSLVHDVNRWWHTIRGKEDPYLTIGEANDRTVKGSSDYVWALQDINFEVQQGEVLGIIGKNGAGKSTLLKLLSRVTAPTTGKITAHGRIASLLEVGTGFHPELTGRENIFLNGAILGMTKPEIRSKFDEIVDFAGCERYIDTPVKRYSSGMYVRLAFAVAAHLEPEILIVDEVLAVGDAEFQKKAIGKMKDVSQGQGRTVLFVSHNMASVQNLCSKVVILQNGKFFYEGDVLDGVQKYLDHRKDSSNIKLRDRKDRAGNGRVKFVDVKIGGKNGAIIKSGSGIVFSFFYEVNKPVLGAIFRMIVVDSKENIKFVCNSEHILTDQINLNSNGNFEFIIDENMLPDGYYNFHLKCYAKGEVFDEIEYVQEFKVEASDFYNTGKIPGVKDGMYVKYQMNLNC